MVILEAFACGVPVIARDIGGIRDVIKNGENGLLFKYRNSTDLAEKIKYLMANKNLIVQMGKNARKKAVAQFDFDYMMRQYLKLFKGTV